MRKIPVPEDGVETLFGSYDENLRQLESTFGVRISTQGHDLLVDGAPADEARVERTVSKLTALMREGYRVSNGDVKTAAQLVSENADVDLKDFLVKGPARTAGKGKMRPKTVNNAPYLERTNHNDIVFA